MKDKIMENAGVYRRFVEDTQDLVTQVDSQGRFTYVNPAVRDIYGLEPEECLGRPAFDFVHHDDVESTTRSFAGWLERKAKRARFENRQVGANGKVTHMSWSISIEYDDQGEVRVLNSIARDITAQKEAEEENARLARELNERVKELDCLYSISRLVEATDTSVKTVLRGAAELIPPYWHYPDITCARVTLGPDRYETTGFRETTWRQAADLMVYGEKVGEVEVFLTEERPEMDQGPFLAQERQLLDAVAERLGRIFERLQTTRELEEYKTGLERMVDERTRELQREIQEGRQKQEIIRQQTEEILELSTPVIQVWKGVVVAPLIGSLDSQRTQNFMERFLGGITDTESPVALLDITGVPTVDTQTAQHLLEAITAANLLGTKVILTGVRPAIAQTLVHLGVGLSEIETQATLSAGLKLAFETLNLTVVAGNRK